MSVLAFLFACGGGDDGGGPNPAAPVIAKASTGSGDGQSGPVGQGLADSFRVVVTEGGVAKAGVAVTWSTTIAGATVSPASVVTDAGGRAATRLTLGTATGTHNARAAISSGSAVTFSATALPGPPAQLSIQGGNDQAVLGAATLGQPLQVKVSDQFNNLIATSSVAWSIASGSGNLSSPTSATNVSGIASVSLSLTGGPGTTQVRAVSAGADTVVFNAHVVSLVKDVLLKNNFFESVLNGSASPSVDTIPVGEAIRWIWQSGAVEHNIIPQGSPQFPGISGSISSPFTYGPIRFGTPGTYNYDCNLHTGMSGIIVVE